MYGGRFTKGVKNKLFRTGVPGVTHIDVTLSHLPSKIPMIGLGRSEYFCTIHKKTTLLGENISEYMAFCLPGDREEHAVGLPFCWRLLPEETGRVYVYFAASQATRAR